MTLLSVYYAFASSLAYFVMSFKCILIVGYLGIEASLNAFYILKAQAVPVSFLDDSFPFYWSFYSILLSFSSQTVPHNLIRQCKLWHSPLAFSNYYFF
uniref:Uncharacterized protein n=1 Tax=Anguilla anguilla TaxID=7936 RepID=A0A0E9XNG1_ANGAN